MPLLSCWMRGGGVGSGCCPNYVIEEWFRESKGLVHGVSEMSQSGNVEIPKRFLQRLMKESEKSKQALRETQIREKTSSITGAGPKRAVAHHMKTLNILEDMSGVWTDITEDTHDKNEEAKANGQGEVSMVREDNMEDVEEAMLKQQEIFLKLKEHITYELGMQTLGGKNKFGFKLVKHREDDPDFDKDLLNFDESDVRAWEKSYVQRERESLFLNFGCSCFGG